jgi:hypothetical protein
MKGCKGEPSWWNNIPEEYFINLNYHCTWQSDSGMRFILKRVDGNRAFMTTKGTGKAFWTNLSDLRDTTRRRTDAEYEEYRNKRLSKIAAKKETKHILSNRMSEMESDIMWK